MSQITVDAVVQAYVATRDLIAEKKKAYDAAVEELKTVQEKRTMWLMGAMSKLGVESMKTVAGTCFIDYKDSATVADREVFKEWVITNAAWTCMDIRVSKTAVKQRLEDGDPLPPGVNYTKIKDIKVRRA